MRRLVVWGTLGMPACGIQQPWELKGAPTMAPDVQFRVGTESNARVYVWNCVAGEHVIISQRSTAMCGASAPQMAKGPCGQKLAGDELLASGNRYCANDGDVRWPHSPPVTPQALADGIIVDAGHG